MIAFSRLLVVVAAASAALAAPAVDPTPVVSTSVAVTPAVSTSVAVTPAVSTSVAVTPAVSTFVVHAPAVTGQPAADPFHLMQLVEPCRVAAASLQADPEFSKCLAVDQQLAEKFPQWRDPNVSAALKSHLEANCARPRCEAAFLQQKLKPVHDVCFPLIDLGIDVIASLGPEQIANIQASFTPERLTSAPQLKDFLTPQVMQLVSGIEDMMTLDFFVQTANKANDLVCAKDPASNENCILQLLPVFSDIQPTTASTNGILDALPAEKICTPCGQNIVGTMLSIFGWNGTNEADLQPTAQYFVNGTTSVASQKCGADFTKSISDSFAPKKVETSQLQTEEKSDAQVVAPLLAAVPAAAAVAYFHAF